MDRLDGHCLPVYEDGNSVPVKYRKRGTEKNHQPDPIVEMGLLTNRNDMPLT